ncbi:MAG: DUF218 domain-containing protein [Leptolyngbyaceae cyanobacterium SM2_5_2]|nr:DUF218 domain-containing protein [Leptolyngbyaceae cyanobacterium SM2_5_2]
MGSVVLGGAIALLLLGLGIYLGFLNLARFLSVSRPVEAQVLIVEGWVGDDALTQASKLFWQEGYRAIITTGPPLLRGTFLSHYKTHAQLAAATLVALGIQADLIIPMPCPAIENYRTYSAALAVQQTLSTQWPDLNAVNLFTVGCHARRSWYIYRRLLQAEGIAVGVIAADPGFELATWWQTSSGVRTVVGEGIAYLYVRLIRWNR